MSHRGGAVLGDGFPSSAEQQICERENQLGLDIAEPVFESSRTQLQQQQEEADRIKAEITTGWTEHFASYINEWTSNGEVPRDPSEFEYLNQSIRYRTNNYNECIYDIYDELGWAYMIYATTHMSVQPHHTTVFLENDLDFGEYLYDLGGVDFEAKMFNGFYGDIDGNNHKISNVYLSTIKGMFSCYGMGVDMSSEQMITFEMPSTLANITIQGITLQPLFDMPNPFFCTYLSNTCLFDVNFDVFFGCNVPTGRTSAGGTIVLMEVESDSTEALWEDCNINISTLGNFCTTVDQIGDIGMMTGEMSGNLGTVAMNRCNFNINFNFDRRKVDVQPEEGDGDSTYCSVEATGVAYALSGINLSLNECVSTGNIFSFSESYTTVSGFVGNILDSPANLNMSKCENYTNIAAEAGSGFYAGSVEFDWNPDGGEIVTISECYNYGDMYAIPQTNGPYGTFGGIVCGAMGQTVTVDKCNNYGDIYCATTCGGIAAYWAYYGIVETIDITNCSNFGTFYYPFGPTAVVGGIFACDGTGTQCTANIQNCKNDAKVIAKKPSEGYVYQRGSGSYTTFRQSNAVIYGGIAALEESPQSLTIKNCTAVSQTEHVYIVNGILGYMRELEASYALHDVTIEIEGCSAHTTSSIADFEVFRFDNDFTHGRASATTMFSGLSSVLSMSNQKTNMTFKNCFSELKLDMTDCSLFTFSRQQETIFSINTIALSEPLFPGTSTLSIQNVEAEICTDCSLLSQEEMDSYSQWFESAIMKLPMGAGLDFQGQKTLPNFSCTNTVESIITKLNESQSDKLEYMQSMDIAKELSSMFVADNSICSYEVDIDSLDTRLVQGMFNGTFDDELWYWNDKSLAANGVCLCDKRSFPLLRQFYAVGEGLSYSSPETTFTSILESKYTAC